MQLKSEIWVHAFLRACESAGGMPVVVRHGDDDAGAIYVKLLGSPGTAELFGPAPMGFDEARLDRCFTSQLPPRPEPDIDDYLTKQISFDGDLWVIEVDQRAGLKSLQPWLK